MKKFRIRKQKKSIPSHEEIARRAYDLFLARGATHGHDVEDWVQAEQELTGVTTAREPFISAA